MRAFTCPSCGRLVTFESSHCLHCRSDIGFDWDTREIVALGARSRCAGAAVARCNAVVGHAGWWCASCTLTRARPADHDRAGLQRFIRAEAAKRRLTFELGELGLPIVGWRERAGGLAFDLLSNEVEAVSTGHAAGVITLDLGEADAAQREQRRIELGEPYRTVLGHLRHEIAHYYQDILAPEGSATRADCRALFGDDRADYAAAMATHYEHGPPAGWEAGHVSAYASMHPWEDWAETFAHYLHIRDTLQTAEAHGVRVAGPRVATSDAAPLHSDPEAPARDLRTLMAAWLPLTYALNAINRSMGAADVYPFVLTPGVQRKLAFVDRCVRVGPPRAHA